MNQEGSHFALELEQIGRRVLASCHGLPGSALQWPLPLADPCSLLGLAEQISRTVDYWVLIQIGDRSLVLNPSHPPKTFAELSTRYEEWMGSVHTILNPLPDVFLDLFVGTRSYELDLYGQALPNDHSMTARRCLIHALTQCAEYAGQIALIRKLFDDGNRLWVSIEEEQRMYG